MERAAIGNNGKYGRLKSRASVSINRLISRKDIAICIFILALIYSLYVLQITDASSIFENADLYKLSLLASGISPYSTLPWQAQYPPIYFILWLVPYLIITSAAHTLSQTYIGFKALSLVFMYAATFLVYKSLVLELGDRHKFKALFLSSIFLIFAQDSLKVLTGDSLGILLLVAGSFFFVKKRNMLGVFFVTMAVLFKIQPIIGILLVLVALAGRSIPSFKKAFLISASSALLLFIVPLAILSGSLSSFLIFESNSLQFYTFNIYSGIFGLLSNVLSISNPLNSSAAIIIDYIWIATTLIAVAWFSFILFKRDRFKNAKLVDILALGLLVWILLLKQTLPFYYIWPLAVLVLGNRIKSAAILVIGNILGSELFYYSIGLLGSSINYSVAPPLNVSIYLLAGGIIFALSDILAIKQLMLEMAQ